MKTDQLRIHSRSCAAALLLGITGTILYHSSQFFSGFDKFFGDRGYCARFGSPHPIVKQKNIISREDIPISDEVLAVRRRLGMDYGKLDFVVHDGRTIVFDVNRTPGIFNPPERMKAKAMLLAPGIHSFFSPDR